MPSTVDEAERSGNRLTGFLWPVLLALPILLSGQETPLANSLPPDSALIDSGAVANSISMPKPIGPLFHNPPVAILNDRDFIMDLFVDFDPKQITRVSLLYRVDSTRSFQEIPLSGRFGRYRYIMPAKNLTGGSLTYFFLVDREDYGLWAYPKGSDGAIVPFTVDLAPPTREFFQRRLYD